MLRMRSVCGVCPTEALYFDEEPRHPRPTIIVRSRVTRFLARFVIMLVEADEPALTVFGTIISIYDQNPRFAFLTPIRRSSQLRTRSRFRTNAIDGAIVMGVDKWSQAAQPAFVQTSDAVLGQQDRDMCGRLF